MNREAPTTRLMSISKELSTSSLLQYALAVSIFPTPNTVVIPYLPCTHREMNPKIADSATLVSPGHWSIGSSFLCTEVPPSSIPTNSLASWTDGSTTFCICPRPVPISTPPISTSPCLGPFYVGGTSSALWDLGPTTIVKANAWIPGLTPESETIAFVKANVPSAPIPPTLHAWVDERWGRSFIIMRRARGVLFNDAFPLLSKRQIQKVAYQVASLCGALAQLTSTRLETVTGEGVQSSLHLQGGLPKDEEKKWPSSQPFIQPVRTAAEVEAQIVAMQGKPQEGEEPATCLEIFDGEMWFYNADLNPTNIFIDRLPESENDEVKLTDIVDWEMAGYFPPWWIATVPRISYTFGVSGLFEEIDNDKRYWWTWILSDGLIEAGFPIDMEWYDEFKKRRDRTIAVSGEKENKEDLVNDSG